MSYSDQILLSLLFPYFNSPDNSRFESLFQSIVQKYNPFNKKKKNKTKKVFPDKIAQNEDKRTSLIIKGFPNDMTKIEIKNLLVKYGNINFLYVTKASKNEQKNSTNAFVNVINYKSIIPLYMNLKNLKFERNGQIYNIKIKYTYAQGKNELEEYVKKKNK